MAENQVVFTYSNEQLGSLLVSLSTDRLAPYMAAANGDTHYAILLYEWNTAMSEAFYGILQGLEVPLRNAFDRTLRTAMARQDWYDTPNLLQHDQQEAVRKAKSRIILDGKTVCPSKVVPELTFGFWVSLTGPAYAQSLWDKYLHKAFQASLGRKAVNRRLEKIRKLRNRVAHHESILARNLHSDYTRIVEAIHWVCPVTALWIKSHSCFHVRFKSKPKPPEQRTLALGAPLPVAE